MPSARPATTRPQRVLLVGGGHAHVEVLRRFALRPDPQVTLTLVSPEPSMCYSGMLPGLVAGHYSPQDTHIGLAPLALWAGARYVADAVANLDLYAKTAQLASGEYLAFDLLSLDVGADPDLRVPGAQALALPVKPVSGFLLGWARLQAEALTGGVRAIAVVGGGAGGVEMLLAMHHRLATIMRAETPRFALVTDQPALMPQFPPIVRARFGRVLVERGAVLHLASGVTAVEPGTLVVTHGRRIAVDRIVWATGAAPAAWPAASGLACDGRGFVLIDDTLRSTSHPFVFATGDCAAQLDHPRPKAGVFAVRQGPPLAANLRRAAHGLALKRHVPQRHALALVSTGDRHAIAVRGPFVAEGDWVWRWKDRIDRAFMAKYALPEVPDAKEAKTG
ncbi:MAG: FAD-dependent oxidoreductase [Burkholderiales bacterium]|nr:FAD-dependent oxidoreductase [Burkholderiales bacterium]